MHARFYSRPGSTSARSLIVAILSPWLAVQITGAPVPVLRHSDVVSMYQADAKIYQEYGVTVLAWGGKPTPNSLESSQGVRFFGSVGMVTEFSRYYERFPGTYEQGLCRNLDGQPVKVPWLTDHQHKGVPYWWCCTQQPQFRDYLKERVTETIRAGADGLHIDDHLGTAGGLWLGVCFCDRCVEGFRAHLQGLAAQEKRRLGIAAPETFNYREVVAAWIAEDRTKERKPTQHPLWPEWTVYQCRAAASFMEELRRLAAQTAGHPIPVGANAGLLWPRHLSDFKAVDLFSAETDHHASKRTFSDLPLLAYRLAEAVQRPYAATASGGDWAFIAEQNLPGLVRGWVALGYAAGHQFMTPHRQWCYTPEKGTHWYNGPADKFAPLYQFVRKNPSLFDGYETYADLSVVLPHRSFVRDTKPWFDLAERLASENISFRVVLAGDEIVDHPLSPEEIVGSRAILLPDRADLRPDDVTTLDEKARSVPCYGSLSAALAKIRPAVQITRGGPVRVLPRVKPGAAVVHLLNYNYVATNDDVEALDEVTILVDRKALGLGSDVSCSYLAPGQDPRPLSVAAGEVKVPRLGVWGLLSFGPKQSAAN